MTNQHEKYFTTQAEKLIHYIEKKELSVDDVSRLLQILYSTGVIDGHLYTQEQKEVMYNTITSVYPHSNNTKQ